MIVSRETLHAPEKPDTPDHMSDDRVIHFGELLADEAHKQGLTQTDLGKLCGMPQHRIHEIFASESVTERTFRKLTRAMNLRIDVILTPGKPRPDRGVMMWDHNAK